MEEFVQAIKTSEEFAETYGELGPVYGKQWRNWEGNGSPLTKDYEGNISSYLVKSIDQIQNAINDLKNNPDSRRIIVSSWNVAEIDQMTLPPCHNFFQFYTRELSLKEQAEAYNNMLDEQNYNPKWQSKINDIDKLSDGELMTILQSLPGPTRAISLMWNQRSVDTFLGLPFNIASYGLLLEIVGKMVNMIPEELIGNLGDTHLYSNHIGQAKEQIGRELTLDERTDLWFNNNKPNRDVCDYVDLLPNNSKHIYFDETKVPKRTREPYPLPKLVFGKSNEFFRELGCDLSLLSHLDTSDFMVENYQSHPTIKAPLSN
jgi:thymidylate synthase